MAILNVKAFTVNDEGFEAEVYTEAANYFHLPISRDIWEKNTHEHIHMNMITFTL